MPWLAVAGDMRPFGFSAEVCSPPGAEPSEAACDEETSAEADCKVRGERSQGSQKNYGVRNLRIFSPGSRSWTPLMECSQSHTASHRSRLSSSLPFSEQEELRRRCGSLGPVMWSPSVQ